MARAAGLVLAALLFAQPPRDVPRTHADTSLPSGTIRGRVVSAATGDPLANAEVRVAGTPDRPRPDDAPATVLTDAAGRYEIPAVAGYLVVSATKAGYAEGTFGARRAGEPVIAVALMNGHNPFSDAAVVAFACDRDRRYSRSRFVAVADATPDGSFLIRALPPGDYFVAAVGKRSVADVAGEIENPEFLESLIENATRVTLGAGQRATVELRVTR